jgi:hypothetical protein
LKFSRKKSCIGAKSYQHGRGTAIRVFTLKTEEVDACETSANAYQNTRRHIPEITLHVAAFIHTKVKLMFLTSHEIFATLTNASGKTFTSQFGL